MRGWDSAFLDADKQRQAEAIIGPYPSGLSVHQAQDWVREAVGRLAASDAVAQWLAEAKERLVERGKKREEEGTGEGTGEEQEGEDGEDGE